MNLTQDPWIHRVVKGYNIPFLNTPPEQEIRPFVLPLAEQTAMDQEISALLGKGAVKQTPSNEGFVSNVFLVPKSSGKWRLILNLKALNRYVRQEHFKTEDIRCVKDLLKQGDYMCKVDLKDAYLTIPIHQDSQKYLKFRWRDKIYQYTALPFGLSAAPRCFTKVLKPVLAKLRATGVRMVAYLDDFIVIASNKQNAESHCRRVVDLLTALGFFINQEKSQQTASQQIRFLGFVIDSVGMTFALPQNKVKKIVSTCRNYLNRNQVTLRDLARLIGVLTATTLAVLPAPLHYRALQIQKGDGLYHLLSYESLVKLTQASCSDLQWWVKNLEMVNGRPIHQPPPTVTIESDASNTGWGAYSNGVQTGGQWSGLELHIQCKLQGTVGSLHCSQNIHERQESDTREDEGGQHHNRVLHQPYGWDPFTPAIPPRISDVGVESREKHFDFSRTSSREDESTGRFTVPHESRQHRVETKKGCIQASHCPIGSLQCRSLRLSANDSTKQVHELETRPRSNSNRCSISTLGPDERVCLSPFLPDWKMPGQGSPGESTRSSDDCPTLGNAALVSGPVINDHQRSSDIADEPGPSVQPTRGLSPSGKARIAKTSRLASVRASLHTTVEGISEESSELILASWRANTERAYSSCWNRWVKWCQSSECEPTCAPLSVILQFLTSEFHKGKQYRTLNSYRSAISMTHNPVDGVVVRKHPIVSRLMKGISNKRTPQPRYSATWSVTAAVLQSIRSWGPTSNFSLKKLTQKLAMLMALANASRCSELAALSTKWMTFTENGVSFSLTSLTKRSQPGKCQTLFYVALPEECEVCPVAVLTEYLSRTRSGRIDEKLFLSYVKPFKAVKICTIARWLKEVLHGIGLSNFNAHSTRGASVTAAFDKGLSISDIIRVADWSSDSMFKKYYYKPIACSKDTAHK